MIGRIFAGVTALFFILGSASFTGAEAPEETYQAALMKEKGEGDLKEAIRLYRQVLKNKDKVDDKLAARAQLRIGLCEEKLGLKKARDEYIKVVEEYPDQKEAVLPAAERIVSVENQQADIAKTERKAERAEYVAESFQEEKGIGGVLSEIFDRTRSSIARAGWEIGRELRILGSSSRRQYASYAFTQPVIPYPHKVVADVPLRWKFALDYGPPSVYEGRDWFKKDFDDSKWSDIMIGQAWEDQGYDGYDEGAWYRTTVEIKADTSKPIHMAFGGVDKDGWVYVNGKFVGEHHVWDRPFILDISDAANYHGDNVIAIRVYDGMGMGGIYGLITIHQPTGDVESASRYLVGRGGWLSPLTTKSGGSVWPARVSRKRYASYAFKQPNIPYPHKVVADVSLRWKFILDYGPLFGAHSGQEVSKKDFDDSKWSDIMIGQAWEDQGYDGYDEGAWYRTTVKIDADKDKPIYMAFGGVDKDGWVYVNGKFVGEHHVWDRPFILDISDAANYHGDNVIAIRVYDGMGMGGIYGLITIHQPTGDVEMSRYLIGRGGLRGSKRTEYLTRALQQYRQRGEWPTRDTGVPPYGHKPVADVPWVWKFKLDPLSTGGDQEWLRPELDDSKWGDIRIGYPWEQQGYDGYDGMAWYRVKFDMNAEKKEPIYALFRGVADHCWIYLNGKFVGEHHKWDEPFTVELTDAAVYKGENTLAIRVYDQDHTGGIYQPITIYQMP